MVIAGSGCLGPRRAGNFRHVTDGIILSAEKLEQAETEVPFNLRAEERSPSRILLV